MNAVIQPEEVAACIQEAMARGQLPAEGRRAGRQLVTQLTTPPRVTVIGREGSGKTSVINMLLGEQLFPNLSGVAAVELRYGDADSFCVELADASQLEFKGRVEPPQIPEGAVHVSQEVADPRLLAWRFAEVTLSETRPDLRAVSAWVAEHSDIALWCTERFDDREAMLWAEMPEHLKDHSFLVLTHADRLYMRGELDQRIARLQPVVAEEFLRLYPVATKQAALARESGADRDDTHWQASGGKALYDGLLHQVQEARMADLDHACLLLERYRIALPEPAAPAKPAAKKSAKPAAARKQTRDHAAPAVTGRTAPGRAGKPAAQGAGTQAALDILQGCADALLDLPDFASPGQADSVLDRCCRSAEQLVHVLSAPGSDLEDADALRNDAIEGEQMLTLLKLERGESAVEDALTVLLQMKKELAERVCA